MAHMAQMAGAELLTPLDMIMPKIYTRTLLCFGCSGATTIGLDDLQHALFLTTKRIPWLKGRLYSSCGRPGVKAFAEIRWDEDEDPDLLVDMGCIAASYDSSADQGMRPEAISGHVWPPAAGMEAANEANGAPVFRASTFRFAGDKGIGLCICIHHNVVDAYGLAEIIRLWTQNISGTISYASYSSRSRQLPVALDSYLKTIWSASVNQIAKAHPEYSLKAQPFPAAPPPCTSKVFQISVDWIMAIKKQLLHEQIDMPSTNTILSALIWSTITRIRFQRDMSMSMTETSQLSMAVNGRKRIDQQFSTTTPYLGNVVLYSLASLYIQELIAATPESITSFARVCSELGLSVSSGTMDARHIAEVYSLADKLASDNKSLYVGTNPFSGRNLIITSWADLDFYDMNFGVALGTPDFVRMPYMEADGVVVVMPRKRAVMSAASTLMSDAPGRPSSNVIEVVVMMRRDDMVALEMDHTWNSVLAQAWL